LPQRAVRMRRATLLLSTLLALVGAVGAPAAPSATLGLPFSDFFEPRDYGGHVQVWSATEDAAGLMYFGNFASVLVYDGARWDHIAVPGTTFVRGVAIDAADTLWIGAVNELGYARTDATGRRMFVSLRERVPENARNFGEIWRTIVTSQGPLFLSNTWLLRWDGDRFTALRLPEGSGWNIAAAGDDVWVSAPLAGWFRLRQSASTLQLEPFARPERFQRQTIMTVLPEEKPGHVLLALSRRGWLRWDGKELQPFTTDLDAELRDQLLYRAARLPDGRLVAVYMQRGVFILDAEGRMLARIDDGAGLPSKPIFPFANRRGDLWVCLQRGILRIDARPWLTWFGPERGAPRSPISPPTSFRGELYFSSDNGLLRLAPAVGSQPARLVPVPEFTSFLEGITVAGDTLIGYGESLWEWRGPGTKPQLLPGEPNNVFEFAAMGAQPGRWLAMRDGGVHSYRRENERWIDEGAIPGLGHIRSLAETADGVWWMGTPRDGVFRVRFPAPTPTGPGAPEIAVFNTANGGLPAGHGWTRVSVRGGAPLLRCEGGLFRLSADGKKWTPTTEYGARFADGTTTTRSNVDVPRDGLWVAARPAGQAELVTNVSVGVATPNGDWRPVSLPQLTRLDDVTGMGYDASADLLWIGGEGGLLRLDLARWREEPLAAPPRVQLRAIENAGTRLPLAAGAQLPYARRSLAIDFAAPALAGDRAAQFESTLRSGDGETLVTVDATPRRGLPALAAGDYTLSVRARGSDGRWGEPVAWSFSVLPPWWRSGWAWAGYAGLGLAAVFGVIALRTRALHRRAEILEATVATRTEELRRSNDELVRLHRLELDEKTAARLAEEKARLELLRYQLNPHFLLNAFTTLRSLVFQRPAAAGDMIAQLAEFCRFALTRTDESGGTVADEIKLIETYLATEQARWRDDLHCTVVAEAAVADVRLPPFLLQPLVENAVKYGGRTSADRLEIRVHVRSDGADGLQVEVANTGAWVEAGDPHRASSTGIGLENLRQRLRRYYPEAPPPEIRSADGWVRVLLHLPHPAREPFRPHPAD